MVDRGIYNFVKNSLAAGKSKEQVTTDLTRGGQLNADAIEEIFSAVESGAMPAVPPAAAVPSSISPFAVKDSLAPPQAHGAKLILGLIVVFSIIGGIAYFLGPQLASLHASMQGLNQNYQAAEQTIPN